MRTDSSDELFLGDQSSLIVVELTEQPFSPVAVLMEEEQEVVEVDLALDRALREVMVHEVQDEDLLIAD